MNFLAKLTGVEGLIFKGITLQFMLAGLLVLAGLLTLAWAIQLGIAKRWAKYVALTLRFGSFGLILFILMEPVIREQKPIPRESYLVHLYDISGSMGIEDYDKLSRLEALQQKAMLPAEARQRMDDQFRTLDYTFDEKLTVCKRGESLKSEKKGTDLAAALKSLELQMSGLPIAGVVVYSDGNATVNNNRKAILDAAAQLQAPIYTVGTAPLEPGPDFWIEKLIYPDEVAASVATKITALVGSRGMNGRSVEAILNDGKKDLERVTLYPSRDDQTMRAEFTIRPDAPGVCHYVVKLSPNGVESYPWNNEQDLFLQVRKEKRRILYVEGSPRYEYRFLRAAFERDERFQVTSMIYLNNQDQLYRQGLTDKTELQQGFPEKEEDLFAYDVVVIGDIPASRFSEKQLTTLKEFVRKRGGGLLFLAGDNSFSLNGYSRTALAEVLPFEIEAAPKLTQPYRVRPTVEGIQRGMFGPYDQAHGAETPWSILPALSGLYPLGGLKPGAVSLCEIDMGADAQNPPVVAYQRYGRGTSLICGISATWPWKFQTPSDNPSYPAFWKEMALVLLEQAEGQIRIKTVPNVAGQGSEISIQGSVLNKEFKPDPSAKVKLKVMSPDGKTIELSPKGAIDGNLTFKEAFKPSAVGAYRVVASTEGETPDKPIERETMFVIQAESPELREVTLNEPLLREMAVMSGGSYVHLSKFEKLPEQIKPRKGTMLQVRERTLWDQSWVLMALLGLLLAEWMVRRIGNMA